MKKIWLVILCLLLLGGMLMFAGSACGAKRHMYIDDTGIHVSGRESIMNKTVADEKNMTAFTNININVASMDVEFISSDTFGLQIVCGGRQQIDWSNENGTLSINQQRTGGWWFFNLDFYFSRSEYIRVYIPAGAEFDSVYVKTASGNVNIPALDSKTFTLKVTSGDVRLKNVKADTLSASLTSGNFTLDTGRMDSCSVNVVSGNINITALDSRTLTCSSTSGNVKLTGCAIPDSIDISAVSGDVRVLDLAGKWSDYVKNLRAVSGDIRVDGTRMGNVQDPGTGNPMKIKTTSGNITVTFRG